MNASFFIWLHRSRLTNLSRSRSIGFVDSEHTHDNIQRHGTCSWRWWRHQHLLWRHQDARSFGEVKQHYNIQLQVPVTSSKRAVTSSKHAVRSLSEVKQQYNRQQQVFVTSSKRAVTSSRRAVTSLSEVMQHSHVPVTSLGKVMQHWSCF